jgi:hypothetical protein
MFAKVCHPRCVGILLARAVAATAVVAASAAGWGELPTSGQVVATVVAAAIAALVAAPPKKLGEDRKS